MASRAIHVHVHEGDLGPIERNLNKIMAQIDDLQEQFTALNDAVQSLMARQSAAEQALNTEIETLKADDSIENSKLEGLTAAAAELRSAVEAFGQAAPAPAPQEPAPEAPAADPASE